jgi:hypothetical protein
MSCTFRLISAAAASASEPAIKQETGQETGCKACFAAVSC